MMADLKYYKYEMLEFDTSMYSKEMVSNKYEIQCD